MYFSVMNLLRVIARKIIFPVLMKVRIDRLLIHMSNKKVLHVMYHGVVDEVFVEFSGRHLDAKQFEQQVVYLKKNFEIITVREAFNNDLRSGRTKVALSFDDGFLNNLHFALPILEKHEVPATFFVSTTTLVANHFVWAEAVAAARYFYPQANFRFDEERFVAWVSTADQASISNYIKSLCKVDRDRLLNQLEQQFQLSEKMKDIDPKYWRLMTAEELRLFAGSPLVEIGSHAHEHYNLANLTLTEAKEDLGTSKNLLEQQLGCKVDLLAYPDGSYTREVVKLAYELSFEKQLAVRYRNREDMADHRIMDRFGVSTTTTFESNMLNLVLQLFKKNS